MRYAIIKSPDPLVPPIFFGFQFLPAFIFNTLSASCWVNGTAKNLIKTLMRGKVRLPSIPPAQQPARDYLGLDFRRAFEDVEDVMLIRRPKLISMHADKVTGVNYMEQATLFGATYSVYVRIARLAMEEAGMPYDLVEADVFSKDGLPANYAARHPFGKIPAFEHDRFRLFETDAIAQYAVGVSGNRNLMPEAPRERSRVIQIMRIMDNYAYPSLVWDVFVKEVERGRSIEPEEIERARNVLAVLAGLMGRPFLAGDQLTLADLWAAPMFAYFRLAPTGRELLGEFPALQAWTDVMFARPSFMATRYPAELETGAA